MTTFVTTKRKVDTINERIDQVMEDAPTKLKVTVEERKKAINRYKYLANILTSFRYL